MKITLYATCAAAFLAGPACAADLIANGGFEADVAGSTTTITGWHLPVPSNSSLGIDLSSGQGYAGCCGGFGSPPSLANQFVAFGAGETETDDTFISQSFKTTASLYTVNFDAGAFGGDQTINAIVTDTVTNLVLASLSVTRPGTSDFHAIFATSSFSFLSAGNRVMLSFDPNGSNTGSADVFVDNVSVIGAAAPEPASWAMMVAGFGAIGGAMRRRRTTLSLG